MHAAQHSDVEMMKLLIRYGADIHAKDEHDANIANYAEDNNKQKNLKFIYSLGIKESETRY